VPARPRGRTSGSGSSSSKRKPVSSKEDDRRFYTLTKDGKTALAAEVDRLFDVLVAPVSG